MEHAKPINTNKSMDTETHSRQDTPNAAVGTESVQKSAAPFSPTHIMQLQQTLGNRAVVQMLQSRLHARPIQREETGIATDTAITTFTGAAKTVYANWAALTPAERANGLGALANAELVKEGCPPCNIDGSQDLGTSNGEFASATWTLKINVNRVSQAVITPEIMSSIVDTIYHESRHSEQWFRMARWRSGMGKSNDEITAEMGIPALITTAAAAKKLKPLGVLEEFNASLVEIERRKQEIQEADAWFNSVYGTGHDHREAVYKEMGDLTKEAKDLIAEMKIRNDELKAAKILYDNTMYLHSMSQGVVPATLEAKAVAERTKVSDLEFDYGMMEVNLDRLKKAFTASHAKYKALPEEADAWAVGGRAAASYRA